MVSLQRSSFFFHHHHRQLLRPSVRASTLTQPQPLQFSTSSTPDKQKTSITERLKETVKTYGVTATIFHSTVYVTSLSTVFLCVRNGLDAPALLTSWGLDPSIIPDGASELAAAWGITAVTGPARGVVTIFGTPVVAKWWKTRVAANSVDDVDDKQ